MVRRCLLAVVLALLGATTQAGYDEGIKAHERGDFAAAFRELSAAAAAGDARSQRGLGWLYEHGQGVRRDYAQAMGWYSKAAAQDDLFAMYAIGGLYEEGRGVARNVPRALEWYRKAATAGLADAQSQLGWLYLQGEIVARDLKQGGDWTRKAAAQGNAAAENNLGWIYRDGLGVPADARLAQVWFRKAAEHGSELGQRNLEQMLGAAQAAPSGSLSLLCRLQSGQSYVFVVDERAQQVAVRDSTGQEWITFRTGQVTRQRLGDQAVPMIDSVRVDAAAIRVLREMRDEPSGAAPRVSNNQQTNELMGLLGNLIGAAATTSTVMIDRNSGAIRTGGMGLFPNNGAGTCEPWTGRRF